MAGPIVPESIARPGKMESSAVERQNVVFPLLVSAGSSLMLNIALVGEQRCRVRDLTDFRRSHRPPDEHSERARAFIRRIATSNLEEDLDQRFSDFRSQLGFRRVELQVSEPADGVASIRTPVFTYQVSIELSEDDLTSAVCRRRVVGFDDPQLLLSDGFERIFARVFNIVEFEPAEPISIDELIDQMESGEHSQITTDYDRSATWCQLMRNGDTGARMLVRSDVVSFVASAPAPPAALLQSFFELREQLPEISWRGQR